MNNRLRNHSQAVNRAPVPVPMVVEVDPSFYQKKQQSRPQQHMTRAAPTRNGNGGAGPSQGVSVGRSFIKASGNAAAARAPIRKTEKTKIRRGWTLADSDSGIDIRLSPQEVNWEDYQLEEGEEWVEMLDEGEETEANDSMKLEETVDADDNTPYIIEYISGEGEEDVEEEYGGEEEPEPESDPLALWPTSDPDPAPAPAELVHTMRGSVVPWKRKTNVHHARKPYMCEGCGKGFPSRAMLLAHQPAHTGERPFGCPFCDKRFTFKTAQTRHMLLHTGKPLACSTCGATFTNPRDLQVHEFTHSGERPFVCTYCSMTFNRISALRSHTLLHTGKPHVCDLCERSFTRPSQLKHHKLMHAQGRAMRMRTEDDPPTRRRSRPQSRRSQGRSLIASAEEEGPEAIVSWTDEDEVPQQQYAIVINI